MVGCSAADDALRAAAGGIKARLPTVGGSTDDLARWLDVTTDAAAVSTDDVVRQARDDRAWTGLTRTIDDAALRLAGRLDETEGFTRQVLDSAVCDVLSEWVTTGRPPTFDGILEAVEDSLVSNGVSGASEFVGFVLEVDSVAADVLAAETAGEGTLVVRRAIVCWRAGRAPG
ncbi:MAG: hypothetical protein H0V04_08040 [Chloroflexi bacterium]|nr:hypothetical protein [Chloroflexota bacterium]